MRIINRAIIVASAFLLMACETTRHEYQAPPTAKGKQCVVQCASVREMCRSNEFKRVNLAKSTCEKRSDTTYRACMDKAKNKNDEKNCTKRRESCYENDSSWRCDEEYNQCFSNCGGTVRTIIEK
jgi:hypothetical protein